MNHLQTDRLHPPPFRAAKFYLVPELWLNDLLQPTELDARELILAQNDGLSEFAIFPENAPLRSWIRDNDDGLPLLVSHTTFLKHLKRLCQREYAGAPLVRQCTEEGVMMSKPQERRQGENDKSGKTASRRRPPPFPDCFELSHWPEFENRRVFYRPREYMANRWPAWLGRNWGQRAALVGLMALMDDRSPVLPDGSVEVVATRRQIRAAAEQVCQNRKATDQIGAGLEQLNARGLVTVVNRARNNRTYRFHTTVFDKRPGYSFADVADACNLDLNTQRHWVALICALLMTNCKPLTQAAKVWALIRTCDPHISTADDAAALLAELEQRAGHVTTNPKRVLGQYVERQQAQRRTWLGSEEVALSLGGHGYNLSALLMMPDIGGHRTHLGATQLVIRYERKRRLAVYRAVELANAVQVQILQNGQAIHLVNQVHADRYSIEHLSVIDCNSLHTADSFSYQTPFHLMAKTSEPSEDMVLHCRFRLYRTGK